MVSRYKGKSYRSTMRIVRTMEQVAEFCRRVCERLQCCPNLFGPTLVSDKCPENCSSQTKTKYSEYFIVIRRNDRSELPSCYFLLQHTHTNAWLRALDSGQHSGYCYVLSNVAYYKKRKVGRPSLGEIAQDGDMTKPARRRKKRKAIFVQKKRRTSIVGYQTTESPQVCQTAQTETKTHKQTLGNLKLSVNLILI